MGAFLKTCGIGVLVIVLSPFWAAAFLIYILIGSLMLLFSPIKMLILASKHKKFTIKTDYDVQAEKILNANVQLNANSQHYNGPVQHACNDVTATVQTPVQPTAPVQQPQYPPYQQNPNFDPRYQNGYPNPYQQPQVPPYQQNPYNNMNGYNNPQYPNNGYPMNQYPNNMPYGNQNPYMQQPQQQPHYNDGRQNINPDEEDGGEQ